MDERREVRRGSARWPCACGARVRRRCCGTACSSMNGPGGVSRTTSPATGAWCSSLGRAMARAPTPGTDTPSTTVPRRLARCLRRSTSLSPSIGWAMRGAGTSVSSSPRPSPADAGRWSRSGRRSSLRPIQAGPVPGDACRVPRRRHGGLSVERDLRCAAVVQDSRERSRGGRPGARLPAHDGAAGARQRHAVDLPGPAGPDPATRVDPLSDRVRHGQRTRRVDSRRSSVGVPAAGQRLGSRRGRLRVSDPARGPR